MLSDARTKTLLFPAAIKRSSYQMLVFHSESEIPLSFFSGKGDLVSSAIGGNSGGDHD